MNKAYLRKGVLLLVTMCFLTDCGAPSASTDTTQAAQSTLAMSDENSDEEPSTESSNETASAVVDADALTEASQLFAQVTAPGIEYNRHLEDVNHDGIPELLLITLDDDGGIEQSTLTIYTLKGQQPTQIYQDSATNMVQAGFVSYYLYREDGKAYLYKYIDQLNQGVMWLNYDIFSFDLATDQPISLYSFEQWTSDYESAEHKKFDQDTTAFRDKYHLIYPDLYEFYYSNMGPSEEFACSIPDGSYEVELTHEIADAPGGYMVKAYVLKRVSITDTEICSLRVGSEVSLERYNLGRIKVETIEKLADDTYRINDLYWYAEGDNWYYTDESGAYYTGRFSEAFLFFNETSDILDYSSSVLVERNHVCELPEHVLQNGGSLIIENGVVASYTLSYHP